MQLAAERPTGPNVAKEKDAAFMRELEENDPRRFALLHSNALRISGSKAGWIVGRCTRCQSHIHNAPFLSACEPGEFCSRDCRDAGKAGAKRSRPRLTMKQRKESEVRRLAYQKNLMQKRRDPALANKCPQSIENAHVADTISGA